MSGAATERPTVIPLAAEDFRRTPWKNGGGVTVDIAGRYRDGAEIGGWIGMIWRFGRTRIEVGAPFSDLSGQDRILGVIEGRGLVLRVADGRVLDAGEPFRAVAFPGEWAIVSELRDGPVDVLNLMGARDAVRLDLRFMIEPERIVLPAGDLVVYAPRGDARLRLDGESLSIPGGDAVRLRADRPVQLAHEGGVAAVASVERLAS